MRDNRTEQRSSGAGERPFSEVMMRLVQLQRAGERSVAAVENDTLRLLERGVCRSVYELATKVANEGGTLQASAENALSGEILEYDPIYNGVSEWKILPSFDHPSEYERCMVSGTGLTHKASAENRAAMHKSAQTQLTDSARMYEMGLQGGNPAAGEAGVQPEWFFKGNGSVLKAHGEALELPSYGWDGGEEPEIAGVYLISEDGEPLRVGLTLANEFSDHQMEKKNYLYLAPSKLRNCSIGPELSIGDVPFQKVEGTVSVYRGGQPLWSKTIYTGQENMSHSESNLEHHHFKYEAHRRPGDVHVHFFGADAFSFGEGVALEDGDLMEVSFAGFGRPLRNSLKIASRPERFQSVRIL